MTPKAPPGEAHFCAKCGSPAVDFSTLAGGEASCRSCGWKGVREDLLLHTFSHAFSSEEEVLQAFTADIRTLMTEMGPKFVHLLLRWGFIGKVDPKIVLPYFRAVGVAIATTTLKVRDELAKEKRHV